MDLIYKKEKKVPKPTLRESRAGTSTGKRVEETVNVDPTKGTAAPYRPTELECALLLLALIEKKEKEINREITRLRVAELTLERLWSRHRPSNQFLEEITNWLFRAGWVLFYAGSSFAMVKIDTVEGWPRLSSKVMRDDLSRVSRGKYDFAKLYPRLMAIETDET